MGNAGKIIRTVLILGAVCLVGAIGAFSAFSSQTDNPGNVVTAGTVVLADNDAGASLYGDTNAKPGEQPDVVHPGRSTPARSTLTCGSTRRARSGRSAPTSTSKSSPGAQASPSFPSCTGFTPDAGGAIYDGALSSFPTSYAERGRRLSRQQLQMDERRLRRLPRHRVGLRRRA